MCFEYTYFDKCRNYKRTLRECRQLPEDLPQIEDCRSWIDRLFVGQCAVKLPFATAHEVNPRDKRHGYEVDDERPNCSCLKHADRRTHTAKTLARMRAVDRQRVEQEEDAARQLEEEEEADRNRVNEALLRIQASRDEKLERINAAEDKRLEQLWYNRWASTDADCHSGI